MNKLHMINKFRNIVNPNSRLYDLCVEAIENAESNPKTSLMAQSEAAKEISTYIDEGSIKASEKMLLKDMLDATSLSDDMAGANIEYLHNLCYRFGKMAPDKIEDDLEEEQEEDIQEQLDGKVISPQPVKYTIDENCNYKPHYKVIPIMIILTILIIIVTTLLNYFGII